MDEVVAEWIKFSEKDLETAKHLYKTMHPKPLEIICYLCQQSSEKTLKAFLIYWEVKPEKTHDLELLRSECWKVDDSFGDIIKECALLNRYSSQPRYPFEIQVTDNDALSALQDSEKISEFIKGKIS